MKPAPQTTDASLIAELVEALKATAFRLGVLVAAHGEFHAVNAAALDAASAALAKAEGR